MSRVTLFDIGLRDVDASGAIEWNKPRFAPSSNAHHRGVPIGVDHPIFSVYHGDTVARPFRSKLTAPPPAADGWIISGSVGLNLAFDPRNGFTLSVEAASLMALLKDKKVGTVAVALARTSSWHDGSCFVAAFGGWRGAIAEYRFWSALFYHLTPGEEFQRPNIEAHLPLVRGWYSPELLDDFVRCVGDSLVRKLLATVAENQYSGAPDLVLWSDGEIELVEIKSSTDRLKPEQDRTLRQLSRLTKTSIGCLSDVGVAEKRCRPTSVDSDSE